MAETGEDRGGRKSGLSFEIPSLEEVQHWTGVTPEEEVFQRAVAEALGE